MRSAPAPQAMPMPRI